MPTEWIQIFKDATVTTVLGGAVLLFLRGFVVPKGTYDEMKAALQNTIEELKRARDTDLDQLRRDRDSAVMTMRESIQAFDKAVDILRLRPPAP